MLVNRYTVGTAAVLGLAALGGFSARMATCKNDPAPSNAVEKAQGDMFSPRGQCPYYRDKEGTVTGGFFHSTFPNKLGKISDNGQYNDLVGEFEGSAANDGTVFDEEGDVAGHVNKENGRVKNLVGDEIGTLSTCNNGTCTPGVKKAQDNAMALFLLGIA